MSVWFRLYHWAVYSSNPISRWFLKRRAEQEVKTLEMEAALLRSAYLYGASLGELPIQNKGERSGFRIKSVEESK